jgi:glutamate racemase
MRVLVFDSGVGGLSVVGAILRAGLGGACDFLADTAWLPYGEKPAEALLARVPGLVAAAVEAWAPDVAVIACNTASTVTLSAVRAAVAIPVVGVVPPVKPAAALSRSKVIGLLATRATIARPMIEALIAEFAGDCTVVRVGSSRLVGAAEAKLRGEPVDGGAVAEAVEALFAPPLGAQLDVVALGCTHFPLLQKELQAASPRPIQWIDPGPAVARRITDLIATKPGPLRLGRVGATGDLRAVERAFGGFGFQGFAAVRPNGAGWAFEPQAERGWA